MNKAEMIEQIAKQNRTSKAEAERQINAVIQGISTGLRKDGAVQLVGFGSFNVHRRSPRMGVHPQTQKPIKIKASRTVKFRPGVELKKKI